jgi:hypothetical protein
MSYRRIGSGSLACCVVIAAAIATIGSAQTDPWRQVSSPKGDFTVFLPKPPVTLTTTAPAEDGAVVYNDVVGTGVKGRGVKFNVIRLSRSRGAMRNSLDQLVEAMSANGWTVIRRDARLSGQPAIELRLGGAAPAGVRLLQRGDVVYELIVEYPEGMASEIQPLTRRFWESFRLTTED